MSTRPMTHYAKLMLEAKQLLRASHEAEDGHDIQYDEGYLAGLKDAKKALQKDTIAAKKGKK